MTLYNNLGTLYNAHEDIPTNYAEAQKYLTKAAEMGLPNAMYGLANLHDFRGDKKQAWAYYKEYLLRKLNPNRFKAPDF